MRVVAAANQEAVRADLEVIAHAFLVGSEGALGGLVGRLVRGETDVTMGAENLARTKARLKCREECLERSFDGLLVHRGMGLPPVAVVVVLQLRVELRGCGRDALECAHEGSLGSLPR